MKTLTAKSYLAETETCGSCCSCLERRDAKKKADGIRGIVAMITDLQNRTHASTREVSDARGRGLPDLAKVAAGV